MSRFPRHWRISLPPHSSAFIGEVFVMSLTQARYCLLIYESKNSTMQLYFPS